LPSRAVGLAPQAPSFPTRRSADLWRDMPRRPCSTFLMTLVDRPVRSASIFCVHRSSALRQRRASTSIGGSCMCPIVSHSVPPVKPTLGQRWRNLGRSVILWAVTRTGEARARMPTEEPSGGQEGPFVPLHSVTVTVRRGDRIRAERERRGLTREQLAETTGVNAKTIARIERGEVSSSPSTARLETHLGIPHPGA